MENASKALIIAGAILLSILIIALGIFIFNAAKGAINTDSLDATEIQTFNEKFTMYEGEKVQGANVKALLAWCVTNASTNSKDNERLPDIVYTVNDGPTVNADLTNITSSVTGTNVTLMNNLKSEIVSTHYYEVTIATGDNGLVNKITIAY